MKFWRRWTDRAETALTILFLAYFIAIIGIFLREAFR